MTRGAHVRQKPETAAVEQGRQAGSDQQAVMRLVAARFQFAAVIGDVFGGLTGSHQRWQ
jgi:hypothetical protein